MKSLIKILIIFAVVIIGYGAISWNVFKTPTFFSTKKNCSTDIENYFTKKGEEEVNKKTADEWEKDLQNTLPGQSPWSTPSQTDWQNMMKEANKSVQPSGPWEQIFGFQCQY